MKAVIQRVANAKVIVDDNIVGSIDKGFLILLGVDNNDEKIDAEVLAAKLATLRIFCDENDKMNLSLDDVGGNVLVISNFTLCGECKKGRRPYFGKAAQPEKANPLYEYFCQCMLDNGVHKVEKGVFGADMQVSLLNDGPVTMIFNSKELLPV
ncbi:MAG TPA: D-tyrosyl-tRNA(Tyr) deacylase [Clostridiales bacterium]|nr:D-tyrosyl-tRNA(Tyr) deacylase [Clostridiales bacterium]